jgi:hypothetical protein
MYRYEYYGILVCRLRTGSLIAWIYYDTNKHFSDWNQSQFQDTICQRAKWIDRAEIDLSNPSTT